MGRELLGAEEVGALEVGREALDDGLELRLSPLNAVFALETQHEAHVVDPHDVDAPRVLPVGLEALKHLFAGVVGLEERELERMGLRIGRQGYEELKTWMMII